MNDDYKILLSNVLFSSLLAEEKKNKGTSYEKRVIAALAAAGIGKHIKVRGSDRWGADATFQLHDSQGRVVGPLKLEIKATLKTQLGGSSWNISDPKNLVFLEDLGKTPAMEDAKNEMKKVLETWLASTGDLLKLKAFLQNFKAGRTAVIDGKVHRETKAGEHYNQAGGGMKCTPIAWKAASDAGLLVDLNSYVKADVTFSTIHYNNKGVYYLQVGGSENNHHGLFIMAQDPARLGAIGVPKLSGIVKKDEFEIEIRPTIGGSDEYRYLRIRAQGRLKVSTPIPQDYSPFSFETVEEINRVLDAYANLQPLPQRKKGYLKEEEASSFSNNESEEEPGEEVTIKSVEPLPPEKEEPEPSEEELIAAGYKPVEEN